MTSGPLLVLVTGLPCSGKTCVASRLSGELGLPMLAKDDIKEALFDALGYGGRERSGRGIEPPGAAFHFSTLSFPLLLRTRGVVRSPAQETGSIAGASSPASSMRRISRSRIAAATASCDRSPTRFRSS